MINGIYKVTLIGQGTGNGIVTVRGSQFAGGDGYFYYSGVLEEGIDQLTVAFKVKRHTPGNASVFGHDSVDLLITGHSESTGFYLEAPGKAFTITGTWLEDFETS